MAAVFLLLYPSLPGSSALLKGISYALLLWFFRVVMHTASHWMMFRIPSSTVFYMLLSGLLGMLFIGLLYGLTLKKLSSQ